MRIVLSLTMLFGLAGCGHVPVRRVAEVKVTADAKDVMRPDRVATGVHVTLRWER